MIIETAAAVLVSVMLFSLLDFDTFAPKLRPIMLSLGIHPIGRFLILLLFLLPFGLILPATVTFGGLMFALVD